MTAHAPGGASEATGFLYPFIEAEERDVSALTDDLVRSARAKAEQSAALRSATLERCGRQVTDTARAMAVSFEAGGRLFTFGNGGSATDAQGAADLFADPPSGRRLPAFSLVDDQAVLSALANDIGFELVFSRQLIALARPGDIVMGLSTSGGSTNVLTAFEEATRRQLLTVGLSGYQGGAMAQSPAVEHCLVVRSESVHRIQENQSAVLMALWRSVQEALGSLDEPAGTGVGASSLRGAERGKGVRHGHGAGAP